MMLRRIALTVALAAMAGSVYAQTTIVDENFESYASETELLNAWTPFDGSSFVGDNGTLLTTDPDEFYGPNIDGTAAEFCGGPVGSDVCGAGLPQGGGTVNRWSTPFNIAPSATENIELSFDLGDDALSANKRLTVGLRNTTTVENIIEMGLYNTPLPGFNYRAILFETPGEGSGPNWTNFNDETSIDMPLAEELDSQSEAGPGWHRYKAVISTDQIVFTLDLYRDGLQNDPLNPQPGVGTPGVDAMDTVAATTSANGFDDLRFGLPSHLPSSGGGNPDAAFAGFDNILLQLVPIAAPTGNADFDGDNLVAGDDFVTWQRSYPINDGTALQVDGDANGDGNVNSADLALVQSQFGTNPNAAASIAAVPEPTAALLGLTMVVCCGLARRRR